MIKKSFSPEAQLRRYRNRFRIVLTMFLLYVALSVGYVYLNYDYLAFKHFISGHYIYTGTLDELFQKELKRDVQGKYFSYFDDMVISIVTRQIAEVKDDRYTYLYNPEQFESYKQEEKEEADRSEVRELTAGTLYMKITNFSKFTEKMMKDHLDMMKKYPNLIIDLRDNRGGDIAAMNDMAEFFLPRGKTIATDKMRLFSWSYKSSNKKPLSFQNIIILQNQNSASASEGFICALKDNLDNVTLIGDTSFGKGIGQFTMPLKGGFAVKATTMLWYTPKGINIQGKGIEPDIRYTGRDILDYALRQLQ